VRRALAIGVVTAVLGSLAAAPVAAARCQQTTLSDIEDEVMCSVCGVPLGLADAPQADRERAFVKSLIHRCRSKREIKSALAAQYGRSVLALPENAGFNAAAYLVPALALLAATGGIALATARWRRERRRSAIRQPALDHVPTVDPADLARLESELEQHEP
jgi:cytochrome c-type biogenesis protein CcmH/NrfF